MSEELIAFENNVQKPELNDDTNHQEDHKRFHESLAITQVCKWTNALFCTMADSVDEQKF
jgi:hypothetical protein